VILFAAHLNTRARAAHVGVPNPKGLMANSSKRRPNPALAVSVLVVDDFADGRDLMVEYLTFRGFTVHQASDGAEAIRIARDMRPDIVLLDLSMPGLNGWEAARTIKSDARTQAIIVIAVTAHALKPETDAAKAAGCDGIVCKPFDITALGDALPRVLTEGPTALDVPGLSLTASQPRKNLSRLSEGA
jgi:CheY-like chemotaxis protein